MSRLCKRWPPNPRTSRLKGHPGESLCKKVSALFVQPLQKNSLPHLAKKIEKIGWTRPENKKPTHLPLITVAKIGRDRSLWVCISAANTKTMISQRAGMKKIESDFFLAKMSATIFGTFPTKKNRKVDFSDRIRVLWPVVVRASQRALQGLSFAFTTFRKTPWEKSCDRFFSIFGPKSQKPP